MNAPAPGRSPPRLRFFNAVEPVTDFYRDLVPVLAQAGIESEIVVSRASYRGDRSPLATALASTGTRVVQLAPGPGNARGDARRLSARAAYAAGALQHALTARGPSVNFFLSQPPLFPLAAPVLRRLRNQRYCCLVMDLYPQVLAAAGAMNPRGIAYRLLARRMRATLDGADAVFAIGRCMRDRLVEEGVDPARVTVVHNWAHEQRIRPVARESNPIAQRLGVGPEFVVLYSGNMGEAHRFETLLAVARRLRDRADIRFVFFGAGARRHEIEQAIARDDLTHVRLEGPQAETDLAYSQSLADVHFVSLREEFTGLMVPSKAYAALAAGRAMIYEGAERGEIARMIRDERIGEVIREGDADGLESAILAMAREREATAACGARARELSLGRYGREAAVRRYRQVLMAILPPPPGADRGA